MINNSLLRNAAAYGRCSTDRQDNSIDVQSGDLIRYAKNHQIVLSAAALHLEDDTSGSIPFADRPKGGRLLRELKSGAYQHLIVPKIDRLGRDAMDIQNTIQTCKHIGVTVHVLDLGGQSFDTSSTMGGMIVALLAWFAQMEVERIRERIQIVLDHKRSNGELTGTVPYGWNAIPTGKLTAKGKEIKRLEPNPEEQKWIRYMHTLRQRNYSYSAIATALNQAGAPTKIPAGTKINFRRRKTDPVQVKLTCGKWQVGNVKGVMENEMVKTWLSQQRLAA